MTYNDLFNGALTEINAIQAGDSVDGELTTLAQTIFNEILDAWNVDERAVVSYNFAQFTLIPNHQPHTIGVSTNNPDFAIPSPLGGGSGTPGNRPLRIEGANLILNTSSPTYNKPLNLRDREWWLNRRVPTLANPVPTDLYYEPSFPNGSIFLWTVPTTAYGIQLELALTLGQVVSGDTVVLAPGYLAAGRLTLAEMLADTLAVPMPPTLPARALAARERVFGNNVEIPRLSTADSGLRRSGGKRTYFDWRVGSVTPP